MLCIVHTRYSMEGTSLQISDLEAEDTGMYQCFATNDAGETNRATYLRVFSKYYKNKQSKIGVIFWLLLENIV